MTYTFDDMLVSDLHKDAYGFRPSQGFWEFWSTASDVEKQKEWDSLCDTLERTIELDRKEQEVAIRRFERRVFELRGLGAKSLDMAISWLHQAYDTGTDDEYLEYMMGLPYGYIKRSRAFQAIARENAVTN